MYKYGMFFAGIILLLTGCAGTTPLAPDLKIQPGVPTQKISKYSNALERLGELMAGYDNDQFAVAVMPVLNKAGGAQLPEEVTMMVESALQNVGEQMLLMSYDGRQDPASMDFIMNTLKDNELEDLYLIRGAITEFDAETTIKGSSTRLGMFIKEADIGAEAESAFESGTIAMDFMVLRYSDNIYVPGVKATAKATIQKRAEGKGFSFTFAGNGFSLNGNTNVKSPVHHVVNQMVEYSMVQLIGRLRNYPYWLVIHGSDPDYRQIRKMAKNFRKMNMREKNAYTTLLMHHLDPGVKAMQEEIDLGTGKKIAKIKQKLGVIPSDERVTEEFYVKLLTEGPKIMRQKQVLDRAENALDQVFR